MNRALKSGGVKWLVKLATEGEHVRYSYVY